MTSKLVPTLIQSPLSWVWGLYQNSFIWILRSQTFTYPVSQALLTSKSMRLVNPRGHGVKTDKVSMEISASSIKGLSDEEVLSRLVKGFFGGPIFFPERTAMCWGTHKWLPPNFTSIYVRILFLRHSNGRTSIREECEGEDFLESFGNSDVKLCRSWRYHVWGF